MHVLFICFVFLYASIRPSLCETGQVLSQYPVVYIIFGEIPLFLHVNIELASRRNPVVVLSDYVAPHATTGRRKVIYDRISDYSEGSNRFAPLYKHMSRDNGANRKRHELRCIQRWFILNDYMRSKNISKAMFGDSDSSIFVNVESAWSHRSNCAAVINIEAQNKLFHWVGAGEASLWRADSIAEFCKFTETIYTSHVDVLEAKARDGSSVVDMSLLWLWWVR